MENNSILKESCDDAQGASKCDADQQIFKVTNILPFFSYLPFLILLYREYSLNTFNTTSTSPTTPHGPPSMLASSNPKRARSYITRREVDIMSAVCGMLLIKVDRCIVRRAKVVGSRRLLLPPRCFFLLSSACQNCGSNIGT